MAGLEEGHELVGDLVPADGHVDGPVHQVERGEHHWEDHSGKELFICRTDIERKNIHFTCPEKVGAHRIICLNYV